MRVEREDERGVDAISFHSTEMSKNTKKRKDSLLSAFNAIKEGHFWRKECQLEIFNRNYDRHFDEVHKKGKRKLTEYVCEAPCKKYPGP